MLEEFFDSQVPPYAILSHTWGHQEVLLQDMQAPELDIRLDPRKKEGFDKIVNSCAQAMKDGHQYIWIDTCCIDKKSSAELSEAINSMFRYYQNATMCYAFLSDVSAKVDLGTNGNQSTRTRRGLPWQGFRHAQENDTKTEHREIKFHESRWFTRGWTLQELIAPKEINFFCREWKFYGTKSDLQLELANITGIEQYILAYRDTTDREKLLARISVAQKFSWASRRNTTRVEDEAYCLLGVLGINMPLLYGEGKRAFRRLQEEIIRTSADQSIFAWRETGTGISLQGGGRAMGNFLAHSVREFSESGDICTSRFFESQQVLDVIETEPYALTNQGLRILLRILHGQVNGNKEDIAVLNCYRLILSKSSGVPQELRRIGIVVEPLRGGDVSSPLKERDGRYGRVLMHRVVDLSFSSGESPYIDGTEITTLLVPDDPKRYHKPQKKTGQWSWNKEYIGLT